jgi:ribose transport system substrate-binding protein
MKKIIGLLLGIALLAIVISCNKASSADSQKDKKAPISVTVLIPSTESEYWQYVVAGVRIACQDLQKQGIDINYELSGPATEAETDAYINALESVIARGPDILILASIQPQAVVPFVRQAKEQGIYTNLVSLGIDGDPNNYGALYHCDMDEQGIEAGKKMVEIIQQKNLPTNGTIGVHMSVTIEVMEGKIERFKEIVQVAYPDIKILPTIYNENDINKGIANVENQITSYGRDLIGLFGNNNISSSAICKVVQDQKLSSRMAVVASDSDAMTINAIRRGDADALVAQTPYYQGYEALKGAYEAIVNNVQASSKAINIPCVVLTAENIDAPENAGLVTMPN